MIYHSEGHSTAIKKMSAEIKGWYNSDRKQKISFKHGSTNSTRSKENACYYIDTSSLNHVLYIDEKEKWVLVEPNVTMGTLVEETLKYNLIPEVVMEFPNITVGGGIQGAALESASFKYGQFNDACLEYELILGNGDIVSVSSALNSDIFYGISGSYGTLALLTLAKIRLVEATPYVHVTYFPMRDSSELVDYLEESPSSRQDFIEGLIFSKDLSVAVSASFCPTTNMIQTYNRAADPWFYMHAKDIAQKGKEYIEYVAIRDYLFRYNRGAFWMGEYVFPLLHIPGGKVMKFLMDRLLRTKKLYEYLHVANVTQNYYIQDYYYPFQTAKEYLEAIDSELGIYPVWLCPIKTTSTCQKLSPHYSTTQDHLLNIGVYGQSKIFLKRGYLDVNRKFELFASSKGAKKMFYAHSYYPQEEFWNIYDYEWYKNLRDRCFSGDVFPEIWEKIIVSKKYKPQIIGKLMPYVFKEIIVKIKRRFGIIMES